MYSYKTRVNYSRLDKTGKVPYHEILNYLQDCSTFQSESLGVGMEYLKAHRKAWIILAYKIQILKDLHVGDEIEIGTSPVKFGKVMATRQFFIKDEDGEFVVKAESIWTLIDIDTRIPMRITEEDSSKYGLGIVFDSIDVSRKIRFTGQKEIVGEYVVQGVDIDTNGHVNNANYLRMIYDYLPKESDYNQIEIVYNKEALEGEKILFAQYCEEEDIGMSLESDSKETHVQIKISKK